MTRRTARAFALPLLLACATGVAQEGGGKAVRPELVKKGSEVYAANCESCHGVRMVGPQWGIDLATFPRNNAARFIDSVTYGKNTMPPWGDVLSPEDIQALWAYVATGDKR